MEWISPPEAVQNAGTPTGCVRSGRRWGAIRGTNAPSSALNGCDASGVWRPASQLLGDDADALSMRNLRGLNPTGAAKPRAAGQIAKDTRRKCSPVTVHADNLVDSALFIELAAVKRGKLR